MNNNLIIPEQMPPLTHFPKKLPEPPDFIHGVDIPARPVCRNVLVFMRQNRLDLQQMHVKNRSHHRHVLMLVLETAGTVIVDGIETRLSVGQSLLVLPFQFHHYVNLESDRLRWVFITFELDDSSQNLDAFSHRVNETESEALELWAQIAHAWAAKDRASREESLPLIDQLLFAMGRSNSVSHQPPRPRSSWIARVESLLRQAVDEHWTLDEVARRCDISERHLRTRFEAETGVTIRRYRANYQLHQAIALMRGSKTSLGEIAGCVGFMSSAAFSRFILRETGMTPMQLKKTL